MEYIALIFFAAVLLFLLTGIPVSFVLGGLSVWVGYWVLGEDFFRFLPSRIFGVMQNYVLIAVPLFIFMGVTLERAGIAEDLLRAMAKVFRGVVGGMAVSVVWVGALLAASTGIVGATVVTMGAISLPILLKYGYRPSFASGIIAASGTLGQIIPPSIVLVLLGSVFNISVGDLFAAAILPGALLVLGYTLYALWASYRDREQLKRVEKRLESADSEVTQIEGVQFWFTLVIPLLLIVAVLGSIFAGIASPTEAAAIGAAGSLLIAAGRGKLNLALVHQVARETTYMSSMVFFILLGATTFSLVFRGLNGDIFLIDFFTEGGYSAREFLWVVVIIVFIAGFFIDFIEIIFIVVPVILPIIKAYGVDDFSSALATESELLLWFAILLAINLQTSFLTPPFGFSLFYLKGVAGDRVSTQAMYRGILPFIIMQLVLIVLLIAFPRLIFFTV